MQLVDLHTPTDHLHDSRNEGEFRLAVLHWELATNHRLGRSW